LQPAFCLRLQRFRVVVAASSRPEGSPIDFAFVTFCAPKGQLPLAQGSALGKHVGRGNAPCKGSYITQSRGCSADAATTTLHNSIFPSFNRSIFAAECQTFNSLTTTPMQISIGVFAAFHSVFLWQINRCFCGKKGGQSMM
jgi:hypothetical protein